MKKNYILLAVLILGTIALTLLFSSLYNKSNGESYIYNKLNKIKASDFEEFIIENPDSIIYISDKDCLTYEKLEKKFIKKLENLNLIKSTVYMELSEVPKKIQEYLKEEKIDINEKYPVIVIMQDGKFTEKVIITTDSYVEDIVDYGDFE